MIFSRVWRSECSSLFAICARMRTHAIHGQLEQLGRPRPAGLGATQRKQAELDHNANIVLMTAVDLSGVLKS